MFDPNVAEGLLADVVRSRVVAGDEDLLVILRGTATGWRALHHLKALAPDPANAIPMASVHAPGTRGVALVAGAEPFEIHGSRVPAHAEAAF